MPIIHLLVFFGMLASGKIDIKTLKQKGRQDAFLDGYLPFLSVRRRGAGDEPSQPVRLVVEFAVKKPSFAQRIALPFLSIPFFSAFPGFRKKVFSLKVADSGFRGIYEWRDEESARAYMSSYAGAFMERNALPGSLRFSIEKPMEGLAL